MAKKARTVYVCQSCGAQSPKWAGRCPTCDGWDTFTEEAENRRGSAPRAAAAEVVEIGAVDRATVERQPSGQPALDRVLGGGVVPGGAVLLAGEPGIGKSTLLLQLGAGLAAQGGAVLYVSAEESPSQLRLRAERLGCVEERLHVLGETVLETVLATLDSASGYQAVLVDSVQALRSDGLESAPGTVSQLRAVATQLVERCKQSSLSLFLVGHVTKEGSIAGPKSLEHLVDTVLTFEGERHGEHRLLRATKNRFGAIGEVGLYEMHDNGLREVADPSRVLLSRQRGGVPGSAVGSAILGTRPLLFEVQALVHPTSFPAPRRMSVGLDNQRVTLLVAVLERFGQVALADRDLFLNIVGGLTVKEPAADLAVAASVLSTALERPLPNDAVFLGEIGLLGEVRPVSRTDARLREAKALGFRQAYIPASQKLSKPTEIDGLRVTPISDLGALRLIVRPAG